jgi:WD40 repeat protein
MATNTALFGLQSKSFAHISATNRIHLYDIDTRKEKRVYVEKNHLSHSYTSSSWLHGKKEALGVFAVGSSDGTVVVFDLARGVVSKTLGIPNDTPAPTDIAFANDGQSVFVASSQHTVVQYNLATGEQLKSLKTGKKGVMKMAMNPKADVLAVAR